MVEHLPGFLRPDDKSVVPLPLGDARILPFLGFLKRPVAFLFDEDNQLDAVLVRPYAIISEAFMVRYNVTVNLRHAVLGIHGNPWRTLVVPHIEFLPTEGYAVFFAPI